jgi:hypothetical protein
MRPDLVVLTPELLDANLRIDSVSEPLHAQALIAKLAVERLIVTVLLGLPGSMCAMSMFACTSQRNIALETNSGPLSDRRYCGLP